MKNYEIQRKFLKWTWREGLSYAVTLMLWLVFFWLFSGVVNLVLADFDVHFYTATPVSPEEVKQVLINVFNLIVLAYVLSFSFVLWRWILTLNQPPAVSNTKVSDKSTAEFYTLSVLDVKKMHSKKIQRIKVLDNGSLILMED